jgi:hypothetical protein
MYVIGGCHVIENDHPIPLLGLKKPVDPVLAILGEFQKEFRLVATMCDVPRMTGYVMSVCSWHGHWTLILTRPFPSQNGHSKPEKLYPRQPFYT